MIYFCTKCREVYHGLRRLKNRCYGCGGRLVRYEPWRHASKKPNRRYALQMGMVDEKERVENRNRNPAHRKDGKRR